MIAERIGGVDRVQVDGLTVRDAVRALCTRYPQLTPLVWEPSGAINDFLVLILNRRDIRELQGLETRLAAGDEITIVGAAEGG